MKNSLVIIISTLLLSSFALSYEARKELYVSSFIKGINLANGLGVLKLSENKYSFLFNANTIGIFSLLANWKQETQVFAKIEKKQLVSKEYKTEDQRNNKKGHMHIIFSKYIPHIISAQPNPEKDERRKILNKELLNNTNDPITGILNIGFNNKCKKISKIFDGKRRYNIITKNLGEDNIYKNDFFDSDIKVIKCLFDIEKIAGYTKKEIKKYPTKGIIWLKKYEDFNVYLPAKIEIASYWGSFICLIKERK